MFFYSHHAGLLTCRHMCACTWPHNWISSFFYTTAVFASMCVCVCVYIYIYIYICIQKETKNYAYICIMWICVQGNGHVIEYRSQSKLYCEYWCHVPIHISDRQLWIFCTFGLLFILQLLRSVIRGMFPSICRLCVFVCVCVCVCVWIMELSAFRLFSILKLLDISLCVYIYTYYLWLFICVYIY
jgi:hypothetical protein